MSSNLSYIVDLAFQTFPAGQPFSSPASEVCLDGILGNLAETWDFVAVIQSL